MEEEGENYLSDRKLLNYMSENDIKNIADLFSKGKFEEIINLYFQKKKTKMKETINIQTIQDFFSPNDNSLKQSHTYNNSNNNLEDDNVISSNIDNNIAPKNNDDNNVAKKYNIDNNIAPNDNNNINFNDIYIENKNENVGENSEEGSKRNKALSYPVINLNDFDYVLNTPSSSNGNLNSLFIGENPEKMSYNINFQSGIIDDYYSSTDDKTEYNYILLEKFKKDILTQQILLTIIIYCLLRIKEYKEVEMLFSKYNIPKDKCIFSLLLLKAKYYFKNKLISKSLDLYTEAIYSYDEFVTKNNNKENMNNNIIFIETYKQNFVYFHNLFNYLFGLNNIDSKIKKLYYEQKFCFYYLNFFSQGLKSLIKLYNKYPNDVQIQFELAKDSVYLSKYDIFKDMFEKLNKSMNEEKDANKKLIYTNYLLYVQALSFISQGKIDEARKSFTEILKEDTTNVIVINNNALLSIYNNKTKESLDILNLIESPKQMDSSNGVIEENIKILKEKFNANLQITD